MGGGGGEGVTLTNGMAKFSCAFKVSRGTKQVRGVTLTYGDGKYLAVPLV